MWRIISAFVVVVLALVISIPSALGQSQTTVTIVVPADIRSLDKAIEYVLNAEIVTANILEGLFTFDRSLRLEPELALSFKNIDDLTWEFQLRPGVRFHNGERFDSEAVRYSVDRAINFPQSRLRFGIQHIVRVETPSPYTVRVTTSRPDPILPRALSEVDIVPPRYAEQQKERFGESPVGTGPSRFVSWTKGSMIVTEANREYWGGRPTIDRIVYRIVPESGTRTAMLLSGEADLIPNLDVDIVNQIRTNPRTKVVFTPGFRKFVLVISPLAKPLDDVRVRQALNYAIDRDTIIKTILQGFAKKSMGVTQTLLPGHVSQLDTYYDYNPEKARALLSAAGYPDGFAVNLYTPVGTFPKDFEVSQAIASQLGRIGVKANVVSMEWGSHLAQLNSLKMSGLAFIRFGASQVDPSELYVCCQWSKGMRPYVTDNRVDELFERALTIMQPQRRTALFRELERYTTTQVVSWVYLYELNNVFGLSRRLNWTPTPFETIRVKDMTVTR